MGTVAPPLSPVRGIQLPSNCRLMTPHRMRVMSIPPGLKMAHILCMGATCVNVYERNVHLHDCGSTEAWHCLNVRATRWDV